jgi:hypothetical protein
VCVCENEIVGKKVVKDHSEFWNRQILSEVCECERGGDGGQMRACWLN